MDAKCSKKKSQQFPCCSSVLSGMPALDLILKHVHDNPLDLVSICALCEASWLHEYP